MICHLRRAEAPRHARGRCRHDDADVSLCAEPEWLSALGHALSALLNFDMARQPRAVPAADRGHRHTRCRPEYEAAIYQTSLARARLGGAGAAPSDHLEVYEAAVGQLDAMGLIYPGFESRAEIARLVAARAHAGPWPRDPDGAPIYPGDARPSPAERRRRQRRAAPSRCASTVAAGACVPRWRAPDRSETGVGPAGETGIIA
jgi:glutamyl-Q tRNA(Asp) synthetase